jgi:hypothetical protein
MPSLPDLPDFPGKGTISNTSSRVRLAAAGAGLAALTVGGVVVRKVMHRGGGEDADADPVAQAPAPEPVAEAEPPEVEPKAVEPEPAKADPPKAADPPKPPITTGTDAPPNPAVEPGNISGDAEPHHALNNPVGEPDETADGDPFEKPPDEA